MWRVLLGVDWRVPFLVGATHNPRGGIRIAPPKSLDLESRCPADKNTPEYARETSALHLQRKLRSSEPGNPSFEKPGVVFLCSRALSRVQNARRVHYVSGVVGRLEFRLGRCTYRTQQKKRKWSSTCRLDRAGALRGRRLLL